MSVLVPDWIESWINSRSLELRPSTISGYRRLLRLYIRPSLGHLHLDELGPEHITMCLSAVIGQGKPRQAQLTRVLIAAALRSAVSLGILQSSPMERVSRVRHRSEFTPWWTAEQLARFLASAKASNDPYLVAWLLALTCGLRRGELLGLQWIDVDLTQLVLHIRRQRIVVDGRTIECSPKSAAGVRDIPLPLELVAPLRAARRRSASPYVLSLPCGSPCTPKALRKGHGEAIALAGVSYIPLHGMRHTMASLAAAAGVPIKVLQTILGHAHFSTTADIYAHVDDTARRAAMDVLGSKISSWM